MPVFNNIFFYQSSLEHFGTAIPNKVFLYQSYRFLFIFVKNTFKDRINSTCGLKKYSFVLIFHEISTFSERSGCRIPAIRDATPSVWIPRFSQTSRSVKSRVADPRIGHYLLRIRQEWKIRWSKILFLKVVLTMFFFINFQICFNNVGG